MFNYKLIDKNNFNFNKLKLFLRAMDYEYPIPLSKKVDFDVFLKRIYDYGNVICMYDGDKVAGALFFYANNVDEKIAFITLLGVLREYRRQGVAKKLLDIMIQFCQNDFDMIQLYTHHTNKDAISFYKKNHFYEIKSDRQGDLKLQLNLRRCHY